MTFVILLQVLSFVVKSPVLSITVILVGCGITPLMATVSTGMGIHHSLTANPLTPRFKPQMIQSFQTLDFMVWSFIGKLLNITFLWCVFNFDQIVIVENVCSSKRLDIKW